MSGSDQTEDSDAAPPKRYRVVLELDVWEELVEFECQNTGISGGVLEELRANLPDRKCAEVFVLLQCLIEGNNAGIDVAEIVVESLD
jgi:hypothetical protein